jgi:hypothetical protein
MGVLHDQELLLIHDDLDRAGIPNKDGEHNIPLRDRIGLLATDRAAAVELLRCHVMDWGDCDKQRGCECSDNRARRYLAGVMPVRLRSDEEVQRDEDAAKGES